METEPKMTEYARDLLTYRGYTPRELEALKRALANTWASQPQKKEDDHNQASRASAVPPRVEATRIHQPQGLLNRCGQRSDLVDTVRLQNVKKAEAGLNGSA